MKKSDGPIITEEVFNTSIEKTWNALTSHDEMIKWFFENIPDFKAEVGFETQFNIENEGRNFLHMWKVREVIPQKLIKYDWKYKDYPGDSFVEFELFSEAEKTKLKLTVHILEDFPDDIPEFRRESCIGGWDYFIKNRLKEYLEES